MEMCVEMYKLQTFNNPLQFVTCFCLVILQLLLVQYCDTQYLIFISFLYFLYCFQRRAFDTLSQMYAYDFSTLISCVCDAMWTFSQKISKFILPLTFSETREVAYAIGCPV